MELFELAIPTLFGLEGLVGDELRRLGIPNVRPENGRVLCSAKAEDIARININMRMGERVLMVLKTFTATTFEDLFEGAASVAWEDYIPKDGQFPVKGFSLNSILHSVPTCQAILKKSLAKRLGQAYGMETLPETGALFQVQFSIMKDQVTLMLDTSGAGLHKRGYRAQGVVAPLRETLAAAMVQLSKYRGKDPFCDPFCGSGTIAIEAAMIARNKAPGLDRSFSAQRWDFLPRNAWFDAGDEAMDKEFSGKYDIWGGDINPAAIRIAQQNAVKAGVEDIVRFEVADCLKFHRSGPFGRIVTNPPYGERLLEKEEAEELYAGFGQAFRGMPVEWTMALLSSHDRLERSLGRVADKKRKLYNGMIKCDLFFFEKRG